LTRTGLDESAVIEHAIKRLSESGDVKVNIPHRVDQVYGRKLSVNGADGSRAIAEYVSGSSKGIRSGNGKAPGVTKQATIPAA
jgi:hypothetical protein